VSDVFLKEAVMSDTKLRVRKATLLLKEDHQAVKKLFQQYDGVEKSLWSERKSIFDRIQKLLDVHSKIEEEIFYPAVARVDDERAGLLVREAQEEHRIVKGLLDQLTGMTPDSEDFEAKMAILKESVLHHAEEEERDLFRLFRHLDRDERDRVSEMLDSRKRSLMGEA